MGLKCAGKKVHEQLLEQGDASYTICRFEQECRLLSQIRHPNIIQFLGVYFQQGVRAPILVMEFLPTNLTSCIEQYGILLKEISYSILHDVALGLCYLHSQTPPIIHRDLSSNNVLLTPNMTAKISDLGVARILNLTPLQISRMTGTPGTPAFMPPEVMVAIPKYDTSVDEFSYGIMMIHMFSGQWPEPQVGPNRTEPDGRLIPVTEAERRVAFLQIIGSNHPLMNLILKCINNRTWARAHASEIVERLAEMVLQFPATFANRLEMLRRIQAAEEEKRALIENNEVIEHQFSSYRKEVQAKEGKQEKINPVQFSEIEHLRLQIQDLNTKIQLIIDKTNAELTELKSQAALYSVTLLRERELSERRILEEREQFLLQLAQEKEINRRLIVENLDLQAGLSTARSENIGFQHAVTKLEADISARDGTIQMKDASIKRKDSEVKASSRALEEKDATISALSEQLTKAREHLTSKQQALQAGITWKQCAELPTQLSTGKTTVINSKVYFGGGDTYNNDQDKYIVYCYDPSQDNWTPLPPLPVRWFGLGQVNGKLVAVGGVKGGLYANQVHTYDERSRKWKQTIPPMPTARWSPGVLSLQSALVVASGFGDSHIDTVEIFKSDTSQWFRTDPLPTSSCDTILVAVGNRCYALGGYKSGHLNQVLCASIDDLLVNAVPARDQINIGINVQSAWKTLSNTPTYQPSAAVLAGNLFTIGGRGTPDGGAFKKDIYIYSPSTNSWVYINDLPGVLSHPAAVAILSSMEILVIGGEGDGHRASIVYKGTLHLNL